MPNETGNGNAMTLQRLLDDLKIVVRDGEELLKSRAAYLKRKTIERARAADQGIRKNPYAGIGAGFALGFALGLLAHGLTSRASEVVKQEET